MPYFDDRTYEVSTYIKDHNFQKIRECAAEFCVEMEKYGPCYPEQIKEAVYLAMASDNSNEIAMLADATTDYAINVEKLFRTESSNIRKEHNSGFREDLLRLLCIGTAILCWLKWNYRQCNATARLVAIEGLDKELRSAALGYKAQYGAGDISLLEQFADEYTDKMEELPQSNPVWFRA